MIKNFDNICLHALYMPTNKYLKKINIRNFHLTFNKVICICNIYGKLFIRIKKIC